WSAYDIVGFTTTFNQTMASLALARRLKERFPGLCVVFGGANCEGEMGLQLHKSFPFVDFVFSGEADVSFPEFVHAQVNHRAVDGIKGVVSRRDGRSVAASLVPDRIQDLDPLPYPLYEDYFSQRGRDPDDDGQREVLVETSRGCWWGAKHHCTFCGLNGLAMAYRIKTPERALREITELATRYG